MEGKEHRQIKNARVSIASRMSRRQPDGFLNVFIFSFQKDPSRENPSVLVPEKTACPAKNPGRDDESMGAGKLIKGSALLHTSNLLQSYIALLNQ